MRSVIRAAAARGRRVLRATLAVIATGVFVVLATGSAAAQPTPQPAPVPTSAAPQPAPGPGPAALNEFIDPALLESLQPSIVGLVTIWEEPVDPFTWDVEVIDPSKPKLPVMTICTGWFDSPTTIATAGHCVDPAEGRIAMHLQEGPVDPETGMPLPLDPSLPEPERTVWAFQPRELADAVLTSPVIVRVDDDFRSADEGDTAKLEVYGMPPAKPLAIASDAPQIGQTVTSIGFPGLNIEVADGVDIAALLSGGKSPGEVLQESRLHPSSTSGTITAHQFWDGVAVHQVSAPLAGGMSGGPTINSRGEVLGINSMGTVFGQPFNVITDTGMLREFLGHDQAQPAPAAPSMAAEPTSETSVSAGHAPTPAAAASTGWAVDGTSLIGGAVLGGLAFGGLAIGGVTRFRRDASAGRSDDSTDPQPGSAAALP
jgi:Trypsin-like peptidase domain